MNAILLSDDLLFTSRITGTARDLGLRVAPARSPAALLDLARREPPACVIVDLSHPGLVIADLGREPPDVLILAGDIGAGPEFGPCLALFDGLDCRKALVPGNHDVWVTADDVRGDSLAVYHEHLPALCAEHGFHYLDHGPL